MVTTKKKLVTNVKMMTPEILEAHISMYGGEARGNSADKLNGTARENRENFLAVKNGRTRCTRRNSENMWDIVEPTESQIGFFKS